MWLEFVVWEEDSWEWGGSTTIQLAFCEFKLLVLSHYKPPTGFGGGGGENGQGETLQAFNILVVCEQDSWEWGWSW